MAMTPRRNNRLCARVAARCAALAALIASPQIHADCLGMQLHAHRGAPAGPENSISAIQAAYAGDYDGVEIDLQALRDGEWALHHDMITGRVVKTGMNRPVMQISAAEWNTAHMALPSGKVTDEAPALLDDVLPFVAAQPGKAFNAEIKQTTRSCAPIERLAEAMTKRAAHGNWFLTSVFPEVLECARKADINGYLGVIVLDPRNGEAATKNKFAARFAGSATAPALNYEWLQRTQNRIGSPVGVHVATNTLTANPSLLPDAVSLRMPVFTYAVDGDDKHADVLAFVAKKTGLLPSGAIIDGSPSAFCGNLKKRM